MYAVEARLARDVPKAMPGGVVLGGIVLVVAVALFRLRRERSAHLHRGVRASSKLRDGNVVVFLSAVAFAATFGRPGRRRVGRGSGFAGGDGSGDEAEGLRLGRVLERGGWHDVRGDVVLGEVGLDGGSQGSVGVELVEVEGPGRDGARGRALQDPTLDGAAVETLAAGGAAPAEHGVEHDVSADGAEVIGGDAVRWVGLGGDAVALARGGRFGMPSHDDSEPRAFHDRFARRRDAPERVGRRGDADAKRRRVFDTHGARDRRAAPSRACRMPWTPADVVDETPFAQCHFTRSPVAVVV